MPGCALASSPVPPSRLTFCPTIVARSLSPRRGFRSTNREKSDGKNLELMLKAGLTTRHRRAGRTARGVTVLPAL